MRRVLRRNPDVGTFQDVLGHLRALNWLYWTAHWTSAGPNFYGDHLLLQRLYVGDDGGPDINEQIDRLGERMVAYFGESSVDPVVINDMASRLIKAAREKSGDDLHALLELEKSSQVVVRSAWTQARQMSLGLDDLFMSIAQDRDTAVYLLGRRLRASKANPAKWPAVVPGPSTKHRFPVRIGYDVLVIFSRHWRGQDDPLYAVLSRRGNSVDFVTVMASEEELDRLEDVNNAILLGIRRASKEEKNVAEQFLHEIDLAWAHGKASGPTGEANPAPLLHGLTRPERYGITPMQVLFGEVVPRKTSSLLTGDYIKLKDGRVVVFLGLALDNKILWVTPESWEKNKKDILAGLHKVRRRSEHVSKMNPGSYVDVPGWAKVVEEIRMNGKPYNLRFFEDWLAVDRYFTRDREEPLEFKKTPYGVRAKYTDGAGNEWELDFRKVEGRTRWLWPASAFHNPRRPLIKHTRVGSFIKQHGWESLPGAEVTHGLRRGRFLVVRTAEDERGHHYAVIRDKAGKTRALRGSALLTWDVVRWPTGIALANPRSSHG